MQQQAKPLMERGLSGGILQGARYLLRGFRCLGRARVLPFVLVPLFANLAIYYWSINALWQGFDVWISHWLAQLPAWMDFLRTALVAIFYLGAALLVAFTFTWLANLVGSPFYGLMAEQVELLQGSALPAWRFSIGAVVKLVLRATGRELQKLLYYFSRAALLALLSALGLFIAPLAAVMPFLWFLFGAKMMTLQYVDYAYDNHGVKFRDMRSALKRQRRAGLGFGSMTALASMVPFFNALVVPAAVCGGTLLYLDSLYVDSADADAAQNNKRQATQA
ncbi:MAG: sulfate transporter CysZ [Pseudomonadales bacterium]